MKDRGTLGIGELARRGGVSRRAIRYYVQEGLLPPPEGLGRGAFYRPEHLERLVAIRRLQERGLRLEAIRRHLDGMAEGEAAGASAAAPTSPSVWTRVVVADGVELHLRAGAVAAGSVDQLTDAVRRALEASEREDS
jgi:DNA-binding transcriptional MerR regulator